MSGQQAMAARSHAGRQGAPPVMRRSAPLPNSYAPPPLASLSAVPAVQRQCTSCEEEDRSSPVQPRLEVGPVGDRYEREADSIAAQVMAMPAPASAGSGAASAADGVVQRACACASSREEPRARRLADVEEDNVAQVRARREGGPETLAASDADLTRGGSPLPAATRSYFEGRMGRDLSGVRVHQGGSASAMNASIAARAFTYRNHVWLGANENAAPSFTMAHELAHVMQQTAPGPIGPQRQPASDAGAPAVQRTYYYEEVGKSLPDTHNEVVNQMTTSDTDIFAEVPVPNYNAKGFAKSKKRFGRADLISFTGSTKKVPIGMSTANCPPAQQSNWYCGSSVDRSENRKPTTLDVGLEPILHAGSQWTQMESESLPRFGSVPSAKPKVGFIRDAGGAQKASFPSDTNPSDSVPAEVVTEMAIGDIKAGAFPNARRKAVRQILNYMDGFGQTRRHYEDIRRTVEERRAQMRAAGQNDLSSLPPALTPWKLKASNLTKIRGVPQIGKVAGKKNSKITLRRWTSDGAGGISKSEPVKDAPVVDGDLFLWREVDSSMIGAWSYLWTPTTSEASTLHNSLGADTQFSEMSKEAFCLRDTLSTPLDSKGKPGAGSATKSAACLKPLRLSESPPRIRRAPDPKAEERKDPFAENYKLWDTKQSKVAKEYATYQKSPKGQARNTAVAELEARQNIVDAVPQGAGGISKSHVISAKGEKAFAENSKAQFWIDMMGGRSGWLLGQMRLRFGTIFLAIVNGYQKAKGKITEFLKKFEAAKSSKGGRIVTAALKIVAKILAGAAKYILPKVGQAIVQCVEDGVRKKIEDMFADGPLSIVREKIEAAQEFAQELEQGAVDKVMGLGDGLIGDVLKTIGKVRDAAALVSRIVGYAKDAFDIVRLAICAAGGLESAGLSCLVSLVDKVLGFFDLSPLEMLADRILGSCFGQTLLGKAMYAIDAVRNLPKTLAAGIIEKLKSVLPPSIAELLCDPAEMVKSISLPDLSEITCGSGGYSDGMSGPKADGSYTKGDWVPPPGYPSAALKKLNEQIAKRCQADPGACTGTPPAPAAAGPAAPPKDPPKDAPKADAPAGDAAPPTKTEVPGGGGTEPPKKAAPATGGTATGGSGGKGKGDGVADTRKHSIEPGELKGQLKPVNVNYYIHGIGGGFSWRDYQGQTVAVFITATDSNGVKYGPDKASVKVYKVYKDPENPGTTKIEFEPVVAYLLNSDDTALGLTVRVRTGRVGGAM
jgi:hypothetical protein